MAATKDSSCGATLQGEFDKLLAALKRAREALYNGFEPDNQSVAYHDADKHIKAAGMARASFVQSETRLIDGKGWNELLDAGLVRSSAPSAARRTGNESDTAWPFPTGRTASSARRIPFGAPTEMPPIPPIHLDGDGTYVRQQDYDKLRSYAHRLEAGSLSAANAEGVASAWIEEAVSLLKVYKRMCRSPNFERVEKLLSSVPSATRRTIMEECAALAAKKSEFVPPEDMDDAEWWRGYAKGREEAAQEIISAADSRTNDQ